LRGSFRRMADFFRADSLMSQSQSLAASGRIYPALPLLEEAGGLWPSHPGIWLHMGLVLLETGAIQPAREAMERAVTLSRYPRVYALFLSLAALDENLPAQALERLETCLDAEPGNLLAINLKALCLLRLERRPEAFALWDHHELFANYHLLSRLALTLEMELGPWERMALADSSGDSCSWARMIGEGGRASLGAHWRARRLLVRGVRRGMKEDYSGATVYIRQALEEDPMIQGGLFLLGEACYWQAWFGAARELFLRSLERDGSQPYTEIYLGQLDLMTGELDNARTRFDAALDFFPKFPEAAYGLGQVALAAGRVTEARRQLGKAAQDDLLLVKRRLDQYRRIMCPDAGKQLSVSKKDGAGGGEGAGKE